MQVCLRRVSGFEFGGFGLLWVLRGISDEWSGWCVCGRIGGSRKLRCVWSSNLSFFDIDLQQSRHGVEKVLKGRFYVLGFEKWEALRCLIVEESKCLRDSKSILWFITSVFWPNLFSGSHFVRHHVRRPETKVFGTVFWRAEWSWFWSSIVVVAQDEYLSQVRSEFWYCYF